MATYVPGLQRISERSTGGTDSAEYCYGIWLRHLILSERASLAADPRSVAEVGPGDSLGTGIAALLTGASRYTAVDLVRYAAVEKNVLMVRELAALLEQRAAVTHPGIRDLATGAVIEFPGHILDDERLESALEPARVDSIVAAVRDQDVEHGGIRVGYAAGEASVLELSGTVDLVFSQAVLEHVDDLAGVYAAISRALRPGGHASHAIDFKSHHFARDWNGQWTFSDRTWALVRGRRRYAINREPVATHLRLIEESGLEVVAVHRTTRPSLIERSELAPRFRAISDEDLQTSSAVIQAVKR